MPVERSRIQKYNFDHTSSSFIHVSYGVIRKGGFTRCDLPVTTKCINQSEDVFWHLDLCQERLLIG